MSLYTYRIFETVVQEGSFVNAAGVLHLTPSAVSHAIAKLENECGFPLFIRSRTKVNLTNNGERLLPIISSMLRAEETLHQEVAQINGLEKGVLRIGTFESVTRKWLPDIISVFRKKYPSIEIEILEGKYRDIARWLELSRVDMAFVSSNYSDNMKYIPLYKDQTVCVTSLDFVTKNEGYITADEIRNCHILAKREDDDSDVTKVLKKHNIDDKQSFNMDSNESILRMASCGFGIGIIPELICGGREEKDVRFYRFMPEEYRIIGLSYANEKMRSHAALAFEQEVKIFLQENGMYNV